MLLSQNNSTESRGKKYKNNRLIQSQGYLKEAKNVFSKTPEKALDLVRVALEIDMKEAYVLQEAEAYVVLGEFNFKLKEYSISAKNYNKAIDIYRQLKLVSNLNSEVTNLLYFLPYLAGRSAEMAGDHDASIDNYQYFLQLAQSAANTDDIIKANIGLGNNYFEKKLLTKAEDHYLRAQQHYQANHDVSGVALTNILLGKIEMLKDNNDKAIGLFNQSKSLAMTIDSIPLVNSAYDHINAVYQNTNRIDQEVANTIEIIAYNEQNNHTSIATKHKIALADLLIEQDKGEEAIDLIESEITLINNTGSLENKSKASEVLSKAYQKTGNEVASAKSHLRFEQLQDSINKIVVKQMIQDGKKDELLQHAQNKLSLLEKDKELSLKTIELLKKEKTIQKEQIQRQNIINYSLLFGFLTLMITSFLVYRSNKAKKKANQLLELKSLRAQMNPHFIFNSLNSVNSFISDNDEKKANRYLADFSRLMRDVMENSQADFIPLSKEISILEMYLKLEHHRFQDKFDYVFEVDKDIPLDEISIPPMILQPYIENAIWHGLRYKSEKGLLEVFIRNKKDFVQIKIIDNGIGREKSKEVKTKNQKTHQSTGLKNIKSRLEIIKEIYETTLEIKLEDLQDLEETGTVVTIKLFPEHDIL